ncbi:unnamed protein product [Fusarium graminearum]|uniref:Chromosome 1, complete genome n=1 Tax=Gibberella zeae (strain ATCC MYA-4620 / CBS 123657 / FGSC 9075 / NRRL 31084 / PH-1) TaxID=229533 RepID=I1SA25_GIBZE|nr:hypothetical protein FGSG_13706 [Fusarium graminearum PH-1]ESU16789.1 hypothetical protein FGSG_13706 [Fusarium graminearum PH-1]CEF75465.1 unnamed protein product [Fusarium graminearum]CZS78744.1 unnamed protein product [Fusarium graminearum]|eukprot:XP_011319051.1 hypothetical protein FGSG_13706 [Fusarium graminearum PH-1]
MWHSNPVPVRSSCSVWQRRACSSHNLKRPGLILKQSDSAQLGLDSDTQHGQGNIAQHNTLHYDDSQSTDTLGYKQRECPSSTASPFRLHSSPIRSLTPSLSHFSGHPLSRYPIPWMNDQGSTVSWVCTYDSYLVYSLSYLPFLAYIPYSTVARLQQQSALGRYLGCASAFPPLYAQPKGYILQRTPPRASSLPSGSEEESTAAASPLHGYLSPRYLVEPGAPLQWQPGSPGRPPQRPASTGVKVPLRCKPQPPSSI